MIFDPLVQYTRGGKIEPGLAESWTISEDHKVYTFKLRPNVVFTDGEPWNAEAMKWNLDRWMPKADYNWLQVSANLDKIEVIDPPTVPTKARSAPAPGRSTAIPRKEPISFPMTSTGVPNRRLTRCRSS
ncbi:MAG: hypothetical protein E5X69_28775 [Mesorhizobium sp.]|nr:MAG: hypothetical protein E5X69_28775 [Mesorhizobium sp.]